MTLCRVSANRLRRTVAVGILVLLVMPDASAQAEGGVPEAAAAESREANTPATPHGNEDSVEAAGEDTAGESKPDPAEARDRDMLYPGTRDSADDRPLNPAGQSETTLGSVIRDLILLLLGATVITGAVVYLKRRKIPVLGRRNDGARLKIQETRMLGNRQFLVVVDYDGRKMLLGVGPGLINHLCVLDQGTGSQAARDNGNEFRIPGEKGAPSR